MLQATGITDRAQHLQVTIAPLQTTDAIESEWTQLQARVCHPVFLDWLWIGQVLAQAPDAPLVIRVTDGQMLCGLALAWCRRERRHGLLHSTVAYLNQTGLPNHDQVWIEYNGLLGDDARGSLLQLATGALLDGGFCDEVHLSMLPATPGEALLQTRPHARCQYPVVGHLCDLGQARDRNQRMIDSFSSNTRHQLRRSRKRLEARYGAARLEPAQSVEQALAFFDEAGHWHRQRWPDSGFANPVFVEFHRGLIKRGLDHGSVSLFRLCFGDQVLGVFYFLLHDGCASFYLQGVREEADGKSKPGLTAHWLLMEHFLDQGMNVYDFMGGDSQYKRQLANARQDFVTLRVHNGDGRFRVEDGLRRLRQRLRRTSDASDQ